MTNVKKYPDFESKITTEILGVGITDRSMVSKDECKLYLSEITTKVRGENWLVMVVNGYLGNKCSWNEDSVIRHLKEVKNDIDQIKLRIKELSK